MKNVKISVIMPVFNREKFLEESVGSVLAQSYGDFEIILIDDGSTDKTLDICNSLMAKEPRIRLFTTEHIGVSGARNIGLDKAEGEYVFFLDSDDIIHPQLFEALIVGAEQNGAAMVGTTCHGCSEIYWENVSDKFINRELPMETTYKTHEESLGAIFRGNSPLNMIGGVMMRRDLVGDTRFRTDLFIGEDYYFIYENLIKGADAVFLDKKGYLNRIHEQNTSWQYGFDGFWTRFNRRVLVWESEENFGRTEYAKLQKGDAFSCFMRCYMADKKYNPDGRKMCKVLREYKNEILPALSRGGKVYYIMCAYLPVGAFYILKFKNKLSNLKAKKV